jgi:hypothetical protein
VLGRRVGEEDAGRCAGKQRDGDKRRRHTHAYGTCKVAASDTARRKAGESGIPDRYAAAGVAEM